MITNWITFTLSIVAFTLSIVSFMTAVRNIRRNFRNACYWSWWMRKDKDTFTKEEMDNLNSKEWNNIYYNILYCWMFGSGFWALGVVLLL
jgi:hypothetical protein